MIEAREIEATTDAVRAPCVAYWLLVFICLMVHLFPVNEHSGADGYRNHGSIVAALAGDDWVPPSGVEEVPALIVAVAALPENRPLRFIPVHKAERHSRFGRSFDPRGPPAHA